MYLASDNSGPAHPQIMDHVLAANADYAMPYGADPIMDKVRDQLRQLRGWREYFVQPLTF